MNSLSVSFLIFGVSLLLFHIPVAWVWFRKDHLPANPKSWKKKWELTDYRVAWPLHAIGDHGSKRGHQDV